MLLPSSKNPKAGFSGFYGSPDGFTSGYTVSLIKPWTPGTAIVPVLFTVTTADFYFKFKSIPPGSYMLAGRDTHEYDTSTAFTWYIAPKLITVTKTGIRVSKLSFSTSTVTILPKFVTGSVVRITTPTTTSSGGVTSRDPIAWDPTDSTYYPPKLVIGPPTASGSPVRAWAKMGDYPEIRGTSSWSLYRAAGLKVIEQIVIESPGSLYDSANTNVYMWGKRVDLDATGNATTTTYSGNNLSSLVQIAFANSDAEANSIIASDNVSGAAQTPLIMDSSGGTIAKKEYLEPYILDPGSGNSISANINYFYNLSPSGTASCHGLSIPPGWPTWLYNNVPWYTNHAWQIPGVYSSGGASPPWGPYAKCPGDPVDDGTFEPSIPYQQNTSCLVTATHDIVNNMGNFFGLNFDWGGTSRTGFLYNKIIYTAGIGETSVDQAYKNGEFGAVGSLDARYQVDLIKGYVGREFMVGSTLDSNGTVYGKSFQDQLHDFMIGVVSNPCGSPVIDFLNTFLSGVSWSRSVAASLIINFGYQFGQAIQRGGWALGQNLDNSLNPMAGPAAGFDAFWREMRNFGRQALGSLSANPPSWLVGKTFSSTIVGGADNGKTVQVTFTSTGYTRTVTP
jgi:hypothetical protein